MGNRTSVLVSWAMTFLLALTLTLQSLSNYRAGNHAAPQGMELVAEDRHMDGGIQVWRYTDPDTGQKVLFTTCRVIGWKGTTELKRTAVKDQPK